MEGACVQKNPNSIYVNEHTPIKNTGINQLFINPTCATLPCVACAPSGSLAFAGWNKQVAKNPKVEKRCMHTGMAFSA